MASIVRGYNVPIHHKCSHCVAVAITAPTHDGRVTHDKKSNEVDEYVGGTEYGPKPCVSSCSPDNYAVDDCIDLKILLKPRKTRSTELTLTFGIIDTKYDLVIGWPDIRKYDLTKRCRKAFTSNQSLDRLAIEASRQDILRVTHSTPPTETEVVTGSEEEEEHTSRSKFDEELNRLVQRRRVSSVIAAWTKLGVGARTKVSQHQCREPYCPRSLAPQIPLYSSFLSSLTEEDNNQPVNDNQTEVHRIKLTDLIGEAGADPFDEMLDNVDHAQFLPPNDLKNDPESLFSCPPDNQVLFPGDEVNTAKARALLVKYKGIFTKYYQPEPAKVPAMELRVDESKWKRRENCQPPRTQSTERQKAMHDQYGQMEKQGIIRLCPEAEYFSQALIVPKPQRDNTTGEKQ